MELPFLDWSIIVGYLTFALGIGIYYSRRAGQSSEEFFLGGRSMPWWILGTSMVATTFAADTPLAITEMSRSKGIWENWFWWNWLLYGLLAVFLFSRLWRRANVLTENELLELRYSGKPAAFLRLFKAGYFALLYNFIVMAWVINGMSSVLDVMIGGLGDFEFNNVIATFLAGGEPLILTSQNAMICVLVVIAVVYALLSGFWGVVVTDVVQFFIAIIGSIALAVIAMNHVGGVDGLMTKLDATLAANEEKLESKIEAKAEKLKAAIDAGEIAEDKIKNEKDELKKLSTKLQQMPKSAEQAISIIPPYPADTPVWSFDFLNSQFFQFIVLILIMWWSNHATDGGGYLIQRTMAAKDEHHAFAANLWYNFANYAIRTWPWIVVALVSMVMFEDLSDHKLGDKAGYPLVMNELLGSGLRGLLLVSFLAAFMSTIDTHLNWGSSYLVHDIYRRFIASGETEQHYVVVSRLVTVGLMVAAAFIATYMSSIEKAWKFVMAMGGGIGLVLILRWFWWRINAWSEISALFVSVVVTCGFEYLACSQTLAAGKEYTLFSADPTVYGNPFPFHLQLLVIVFVSMVTWISVTYLTKPEPEKTLISFYEVVQPGGWWKPIAGKVKTTLPPVGKGIVLNFFAGLAFVWGGMFCIGYLIFANWIWAGIAGVSMVAGFGHIWFHCLRNKE